MLGIHKNTLRKMIAETLGVTIDDISLEGAGNGIASAVYDYKKGSFHLDVSSLKFFSRQAQEDGSYSLKEVSKEQKEIIVKKVNSLEFPHGKTHAQVEKGVFVNLFGGFTSDPEKDVAGKAYHEFISLANSAQVITSDVLIIQIKKLHANPSLKAAFASGQFCNQISNTIVAYTAGEVNALIEKNVPPMTYAAAIEEIKTKTAKVKELIFDYHEEALLEAQTKNKATADATVQKKLEDLNKKIKELEEAVTQKYTQEIHQIQSAVTSIYAQEIALQTQQALDEQQKAYNDKFNEILVEMTKKLKKISEQENAATQKSEEVQKSYDEAAQTFFEFFGVEVVSEGDKTTLKASPETSDKLKTLGLTLDDLTDHNKLVSKLAEYLETDKGKDDEKLKKVLPTIKKLLGHDPTQANPDADLSEFSGMGS